MIDPDQWKLAQPGPSYEFFLAVYYCSFSPLNEQQDTLMQHTLIDDKTALQRLGKCVLAMVGVTAILIVAISIAV